jgi:RNA polymerase sigma factor (sigma-70 family)
MNLLFLNDDARILDQIRKGKEEALVRLYEMNERQVTSFVTRNNGSEDDAEEMLQEALVILWERIRSGRYEHTAKISTFVFATVRNLWLRKIARSRREVASDMQDALAQSNEISVLDSMIEAEKATAVSKALDSLGDPCRQLLLLYYWEELSMDDIAMQMGFANADTAKSKKYQCKKALEKLLRGLRRDYG